MSGDSPGASRGYGPFQEEAEPTARIVPGESGAATPAEPSGQDHSAEPTAVIQPQPQPQPQPQTQPPTGAPAGSGPAVAGADGTVPSTPEGSASSNTAEPATAPAGPWSAPISSSAAPAPPSDAADDSGPHYGPHYGPFRNSGPTHSPTSGGPSGMPTSGAAGGYGGAPTSGGPGGYGGMPTSVGPGGYGGMPASGGPGGYSAMPISGGPGDKGADPYGLPAGGGGVDRYGLAPSSGGRFDSDADRFGFEAIPANRGPRIEPSPPPQRGQLLVGILAGLAAGLLLFGGGGFFAGRLTADNAAPAPQPTQVTPSAGPALGVYEQSQVDVNKARFTGQLGTISQGWLPYLATCERPKVNRGEKARVRCRFDGMSVIFVEYSSIAERDKARVATLGQNVDARTLTPGVGPAGDKAARSGRTSGNYVEFAYTVEENRARQTISGIWWDDTQTPVAAYMLAYWKVGVGESWDPMRDVWARYA